MTLSREQRRLVVACVVVAAVFAGVIALASRDGKTACTTQLSTNESKGTARHADEATARRRSVTAACSYDCSVTLTIDQEPCVQRCLASVDAGAIRATTTCAR